MTLEADKIGFMQGRLTPVKDGVIQEFPWSNWVSEFELAQQHQFSVMEWTIDQDRLYENPLMTPTGQEQIKRLCQQHCLTIPSLTADCFMQAPFWKSEGKEREHLIDDFLAVCEACSAVGIGMIVVPLVDNGRLDTSEQQGSLLEWLTNKKDYFHSLKLQIIFESDFNPADLHLFINELDEDVFGINYDIGNSASLGYHPSDEFAAYGDRIINVHVKDRPLNGTTVPFGKGSADFETVFKLLRTVNYSGNYILQGARAEDGDDAAALGRYRSFTLKYFN